MSPSRCSRSTRPTCAVGTFDEDYQQPREDIDFRYAWENFRDVRAFYDRAAAAGLAVIFTAT